MNSWKIILVTTLNSNLLSCCPSRTEVNHKLRENFYLYSHQFFYDVQVKEWYSVFSCAGAYFLISSECRLYSNTHYRRIDSIMSNSLIWFYFEKIYIYNKSAVYWILLLLFVMNNWLSKNSNFSVRNIGTLPVYGNFFLQKWLYIVYILLEY
jgi:hypothetical protein